MIATTAKARVLAERGDNRRGARARGGGPEPRHGLGDSQDLVPSFATAAAIRSAAGDARGRCGTSRSSAAVTRDRDPSKRAHELPVATRIAVTWGAAEIARGDGPEGEPNYLRSRLCIAQAGRSSPRRMATWPGAANRHTDAAREWAAYGHPLEEAYALLGAARCLYAMGRGHETATGTQRVVTLARSLGARPLLDALDR